jgi:hypothetical protein
MHGACTSNAARRTAPGRTRCQVIKRQTSHHPDGGQFDNGVRGVGYSDRHRGQRRRFGLPDGPRTTSLEPTSRTPGGGAVGAHTVGRASGWPTRCQSRERPDDYNLELRASCGCCRGHCPTSSSRPACRFGDAPSRSGRRTMRSLFTVVRGQFNLEVPEDGQHVLSAGSADGGTPVLDWFPASSRRRGAVRAGWRPRCRPRWKPRNFDVGGEGVAFLRPGWLRLLPGASNRSTRRRPRALQRNTGGGFSVTGTERPDHMAAVPGGRGHGGATTSSSIPRWRAPRPRPKRITVPLE